MQAMPAFARNGVHLQACEDVQPKLKSCMSNRTLLSYHLHVLPENADFSLSVSMRDIGLVTSNSHACLVTGLSQ